MCEHSGVNRILAPCHIPREHGRQRCIAFALAVVQRRIFLRETPDVEHGTAWRIYTGLQISPNEACVSATAFGLEAGIIIRFGDMHLHAHVGICFHHGLDLGVRCRGVMSLQAGADLVAFNSEFEVIETWVAGRSCKGGQSM